MERLSALDASFLQLESGNSHLHVGSIIVLEGPAPDAETFAVHLGSRLGRAPRLRQRLQGVPLGIARPVWVDDDAFDLGFHVRRTTLPGEGGVDELQDLVSRVMARPLDRRKPLWELWVVDGIDGEHWALVSKVHQSVLDAIDGTDLIALLMDATDEVTPPSAADAAIWTARPAPSSVGLVRSAIEEVVNPGLPLSLARSALRAPGAIIGSALATARGLGQLGGLLTPRSSPHLTGPVGPNRTYRWLQFPLDDLREVKDGLGGTVNDVVLAMVTTGFRDLLDSRGVDTTGRRLRTMLPVSVHDTGAGREDRITAMFAELPVREQEPAGMLAAIQAQTRRLKNSGQVVDATAMTQVAGFAPPALLGLGLRAATKVAAAVDEIAVDTIVTNAPGPQSSRWVLGHLVFHAFPYLPLARPIRLSVAIYSYDGEVTFGITADPDAFPDLDDFTSGLEAGLLELQHAAAQAREQG